MTEFTEAELITALKDCFVPALRRDVVAAALVRSATLERDTEAPGTGIPGVPARFIARVILAAPGGDEVGNAQLRGAVENRLLGIPQISQAKVTLQPPLFAILS